MCAILDTGSVVKEWYLERVHETKNGLLTLADALENYDLWVETSRRRGFTPREFKKRLAAVLNREPKDQPNNKLTGGRKLTNVWTGVALKTK